MGKEHRLAERRQQIVTALADAGQLSVIELSRRFDVSEVTIRQDLQSLHEQGQVLRTRGGALAINSMPEYSFDVRQQQHSAIKARIGQAAAALVNYGDTIYLDASTTALALIPPLKRLSELTIITNSLKIAMSLLDAPHIHVMLPGGSLRRTAISVVGQLQPDFLEGINIQLGFFGARGLSVPEGMTDVGLEEMQLKRAMVARCRQVVGVVDARKWGKVAAATFATLDQINTVITDDDAPAAMIEAFRSHQIEVIIV